MISTLTHLLDDSTVGGVTRMLQHLATDPSMMTFSRHATLGIRRGRLTAPKLKGDVIVSNLSISWRNLPFFFALRAANPHTPIVHVEHSYSEAFVASNVEHRDRFETLVRTVYSLADIVVAVSDEQKRWMSRKSFCRREKLRVIEPCGDLEPFFRLAPSSSKTPKIVGAVGRFDTQKGFDVLVDAFRSPKLADYELHLWGAGAEGDALRARASWLPNVVFRGFAETPAAALANCDLVAMPSRWEPFGIVAIEAKAAGRPLLCTRVDGLRDHIQRGALYVAENTPHEWASRISSLTHAELAASSQVGRIQAAGANAKLVESWRELVSDLRGGVLGALPPAA